MSESQKNKNIIDEKKRALREMEKSIKEKEKRIAQKKINEIGKLAVKAKIAEVDPEILFGAFIDLSKKVCDESYKSLCLENAKKKQPQSTGKRLAISFKNPPTIEVKEQLKNLSFKWNKFRGEFYGTCEKDLLISILKNIEHKIEVIE